MTIQIWVFVVMCFAIVGGILFGYSAIGTNNKLKTYKGEKQDKTSLILIFFVLIVWLPFFPVYMMFLVIKSMFERGKIE